MGHRSIILLISALLAVAATNVMALGLGKITLDSALNEPLKAEIELFEVRELTEGEIKVAIASREDFDRIGVDKTYFLSDLKFKVILRGAGAPKVEVTSTKLVREPFLNFVLQVQWPAGKLLREYTLLMDLPVYSQDRPAAVSQPTAPSQRAAAPRQQTQASSGSEYNPRSAFEGAPARPSSGPVTPSYTEDTYRVQQNDTLWEIAARVRPDRSVSIHQTMLAIQRDNPDAFINNNINLLKKGKILRIPNQQDMSSLNQRQAVREVAVQNSAWSGQEVADAQLSGARTSSGDAGSSTEREGRIKLSSPEDSFDSNEGRSSGGLADSSTEALENELAITMEQLDKSSRENDDLRSKVSSLEEQIQTMERMLEVSNENLRALELAAEKNAQAEAEAEEEQRLTEAELATETSDDSSDLLAEGEESSSDNLDDLYGSTSDEEIETADEELSSEGDVLASSEDVVEAEQEEIIEEQPVATPTSAPVADKKKVVAKAPTPEKGIVDTLLDYIIYIVVGLVVLGVGAFYLLRQKSSDDEDEDDYLHSYQSDEPASEDILAPEDSSADDSFSLEGLEDVSEAPEEFEAEPQTAEEPELGSEAQTEDVVAETDIYIAYGKFDQAEEMLLKALDSDPGDEDVRLKLLEVYSLQGDAENFDPHFAKLKASASPNTMDRAETLRSNIPNIGEFDDSAFESDAVQPMTPELDDEGTDTVIAYHKTSAQEDATPEDDTSLDTELDIPAIGDDLSFDEGLSLDDELSIESEASEPEDDLLIAGNTDDSLELDLDLGESTDSEESFDLELDTTGEDSNVVELDEGLDFDLGDSDTETEDSFSLDADLGSDLDLSADLDSLDLESTDSPTEDGLDLEFDLGAGDATESDDLSTDSLEADLASLEADLDLSLGEDLPAGDELTAELGDLEGDDDASLADTSFDADASFDLEAELGDVGLGDDLTSSVSSDTVVNEALNDDYLEQKLSQDPSADLVLDDDLPLETDTAEAEAPSSSDEDILNLDEEADLDLSSLDQELDALTSDLGDVPSLTLDDDAAVATLDEPVTNFDDFEDELERNEAEAETVSADQADTSADVDSLGDDGMFDQAISEVPSAPASEDDLGFELPEVDPEDVGDDDLDFLSDSDEIATKLDLARAYIDMGDQEGARDIIREVVSEGNEQQKAEAQGLLARIEG